MLYLSSFRAGATMLFKSVIRLSRGVANGPGLVGVWWFSPAELENLWSDENDFRDFVALSDDTLDLELLWLFKEIFSSWSIAIFVDRES